MEGRRKEDGGASPTSSPPTPPSPLPISVGPGNQHYYFTPSPSPSPPFSETSSRHASAELLPLVQGKFPSSKVPSSAFFLDSREPDYLDSKSSCLEDLNNELFEHNNDAAAFAVANLLEISFRNHGTIAKIIWRDQQTDTNFVLNRAAFRHFAFFIFLSLALSVVFDKDGVLEQISDGKGYIDMSTIDADTSSKIGKAISAKGGSFLEAPVSGSKKPAEDGQLVILAAGEKALYDEVIPAFDVMGKKSFYLGEVGNGAKMKLVVNMIMGSMMNAFSEGLVLAGRSGLDPHTLLDVLDLGAIANPMFKLKGPSMIQSNYAPAFPLKHQQKDMRLALSLGDEHAVSMPVAAAANEAFKKARSIGLGDLDFSAVHDILKVQEPSS
ncbi:hypothetical protein TIFTF001_002007 [Ficus carica]|uniref:Uncharacterized protein n=1 Tax=Ficus carica TaxID=3494 RepID=A0AA88CSE7_FICCA|nr:hypothetical protein TIFTF001_002007 [Ficus carica]